MTQIEGSSHQLVQRRGGSVSSVFSLWYDQRMLTNFKMRTLYLSLLLLLMTPMSDAAELHNNVLAYIVNRFHRMAGNRMARNQGGEFAFLMALTPAECGQTNSAPHFNPGKSRRPSIVGSANSFRNVPNSNYIAVYPNSGSRCSENKLLYPTENNQEIAAQQFQNQLNQPVGCVILYTTYTPCLRSCFINMENCTIIPALQQPPFRDIWTEPTIHKYFVFSRIYKNDNNTTEYQRISGRLNEVQRAGFHIRRCDGAENAINCIECTQPHYCIP
ncbi:uncharacterized protein LOC132205978 isoform X1 [Stegostoma tigrinum]|uniref:uncharacterized protein LOC132205978 isoform X1 n=2 Tax=Stegostoma tigrinum TaxID=3053191 RepID=UPI00286FC984|nr:uncharacterized protein LOC132205978 isoform X1 [Stegostoma tigrinum]